MLLQHFLYSVQVNEHQSNEIIFAQSINDNSQLISELPSENISQNSLQLHSNANASVSSQPRSRRELHELCISEYDQCNSRSRSRSRTSNIRPQSKSRSRSRSLPNTQSTFDSSLPLSFDERYLYLYIYFKTVINNFFNIVNRYLMK